MPHRTRPHWKNLRPLRPEGAGPTFVCVHGDEANELLPKHLDHGRPFYAFIHQGKDRKKLHLQQVEDIAAHYLQELLAARPHGEYVLCGYSFGGIIAYEMAQQLRSQGRDVPQLILIDAYAPDLHVQALDSDHNWLSNLKHGILMKVSKPFIRLDPPMPANLHHHHIIGTYDKAIRSYKPRPYDGQVMILKAKDAWGPDDLGWTMLSRQLLDIHRVPGDHYSVIKEPHVAELAAQIEERLSRIATA